VAQLFDQLAPAVYRRHYPMLQQNIGVVVGEAAVLVVDTRSAPSHASEIVEDLKALTDLPVGWVVNTHWHWDHVLGNSAFGGVPIWAHIRCREALETEAAATIGAAKTWLPDLTAELDTTEVVPPTETFDSLAEVDLGGITVRLVFRGRGHTDSDVMVHTGHVLFAGDLLEEGAPPSFGDSYPLQWPATLGAQLVDAPPTVVPGHGAVMDRVAAATQLEELEDVARRCSAAATESDLDVTGAPYPADVMQLAFARSLVERG